MKFYKQSAILKKQDNIFLIQPQTICFKDIQVKLLNETSISIRNITEKSQRIRIQQPKTIVFKCDYNLKDSIAPGLSYNIKIYFECSQIATYSDSIIIFSDNYKKEIFLEAHPSNCQIQFNEVLECGFIMYGTSSQFRVPFKNIGKQVGNLSFIKHYKLSNYTIYTSRMIIKPGETNFLKLMVQPRQTGIKRQIIEIYINNSKDFKTLDLLYNCVQYLQYLVDSQGFNKREYELNDMYYGEIAKIKCTLINNTPKKNQWIINIKKGVIQKQTKNLSQWQTPQQMGKQQTQTILIARPSYGIIQPFSGKQIQIQCRPKVTQMEVLQTIFYSKMNQIIVNFPKQYDLQAKKMDYTLFLELGTKKQNEQIVYDRIVHHYFYVNCLIPTIKISKNYIEFQEIAVKDNAEQILQIQNINMSKEIDIRFQKKPNFQIIPSQYKIPPNSLQTFIVVFRPMTLGKFQQQLNVCLLNKQYKIPITLKGKSTYNQNRLFKICSIKSSKEEHRYYKTAIQGRRLQTKSKQFQRILGRGLLSQQKMRITVKSPKKQMEIKSNNYLKERRLIRTRQIRKRQYNKWVRTMQIQSQQLKSTQQILNDQIDQINSSKYLKSKQTSHQMSFMDPQFYFNRSDTKLQEIKMKLPSVKQKLFVYKPIFGIEPSEFIYAMSKKKDKRIEEQEKVRKPFPSKPKSSKQINDIKNRLTGKQLQHINTFNTKIIEFNKISINSEVTKPFHVKNELSAYIQVRIQLDSNNQDFLGTYLEPQIIPPMQLARFNIVLKRTSLGQFRSNIKFIVNQHHIFYLPVHAQVQHVTLICSRSQIKFNFADDCSQMQVTETFELMNISNTTANFWIENSKSCFTFVPNSGQIKKSITINVHYRPQQILTISAGQVFLKSTATKQYKKQKVEQDYAKIKIKDGPQILILCKGIINQMKCSIKEIECNFDTMLVSKQISKIITIKNSSSSSTAFEVQRKGLPECCHVYPQKGKIMNDGFKNITIKILSKEEIIIDETILFHIRGGPSITLPIIANVIIPSVYIQQQKIDFGTITILGIGHKQFTIVNDSCLQVQLNLDLRQSQQTPGNGCLQLQDLTTGLNIHITSQKSSTQQSEQQTEQNLCEKVFKNTLVRIVCKENSKLTFSLIFRPRQIAIYQFQLPLSINNFGKIPGIKRMVACVAAQARFKVQPQNFQFPKKIIQPNDFMPATAFIQLTNPDIVSIKWKLDEKILQDCKYFIAVPSKGQVQGLSRQTFKIIFKPDEVGKYSMKLPIYLYDERIQKFQNYLELTFKGEGAKPKLYYDRKQIIISPVPLEIETKASFKIFNQGYQNMNIDPILDMDNSIFTKDVEVYNQKQKVLLKVLFPEGSKVGINKTKISGLVKFKSKRPISFTVKMYIYDSNGKPYPIAISGTADNSILTYYNFCINLGEVIEVGIKNNRVRGTLLQQYEEKQDKSRQISTLASTIFKEYNQISKNFIIMWIKYFCPNIKLVSFPQNLIQQTGQQYVQFINNMVTKKEFEVFNQNIIGQQQPYIQRLKYYEKLIFHLKSRGAFLNHIRPYYLLSYSQYGSFVKHYQQTSVHPLFLKQTQKNFFTISSQTWISLFYQIIKTYLIPKIPKNLTKCGFLPEKQVIQEFFVQPSNLFSQTQLTILKWLQVIHESIEKKHKIFLNFDSCFNDQLLLCYIVQFYSYSKQKQFESLRKDNLDYGDILYNVKKILNILGELNLSMQFNQEDVVNFGIKQRLLFLIHLFVSLPNYIPKSQQLIFSCLLGQSTQKFIQLSNSTSKPINYWVKLQGCRDFVIEQQQLITIPPKSKMKFKVKFSSRLFQSVSAWLMFINKKGSGINAAAIVFELKSQIKGRKSIQKPQIIRGHLYEKKDFKIYIQNKFQNNQYADFQIFFFNPQTNEKIEIDLLKEYPVFFCRLSQLRLKRNSSYSIEISYLPLVYEKVKTMIVFCDPTVGQFQIELIGQPELPRPIQQIIIPNPFYVQQESTYQLSINPINIQLMRAKAIIENMIYQKQKLSNIFVNRKERYQMNIQNQYTIQYTEQSFVQMQKYIEFGRKKKQDIDSKFNDGLIKLPIKVCFTQFVKDFSIQILIKNNKLSDIRRNKVIFNVLPKPIVVEMHMQIPVKKSIEQNIPIVNNTEKDWKLKYVFHCQSHPQYFAVHAQIDKISKQIIVKKKLSSKFVLVFSPKWICNIKANLIIMNLSSNDNMQYTIQAIGQEPLSEGHLTVKCQLHKPQTVNIPIINTSNVTQTYQIQTDLINCYGPQSIMLLPGKKTTYPLTINPLISGRFTGTLIFYDEQRQYFWYTFTFITQDGQVDGVIDLISSVRKPIDSQIVIHNGSDNDVQFQVFITGTDLFGNNILTVPKNQSAVYKFCFRPLSSYTKKGRIAFVNQTFGQKVYLLNLISQSPIIRLPQIKAEIGKSQKCQILLQNPTKFQVKVDVKVSRPQHYIVQPHNIILNPLQATPVIIIYEPTILHIQDKCEIIFSTKQIGDWKYLLFGIGVLPQKLETLVLITSLNRTVSNIIKFKNPFKQAITVHIHLECNQPGQRIQAFSLKIAGKEQLKSRIVLESQQLIEINVQFCPQEIQLYMCKVFINLSDSISWKYKLEGHVESFSNTIYQTIKTKCRIEYSKYIQIKLNGLSQLAQQTFLNNLSLEFQGYPLQYKQKIQNSIQFRLMKNQITDPEEKLRVFVKFLPYKPFKTLGNLIIKKESGGIWKFKILIEALPPDIDDLIILQADIKNATTVTFELTNRTQQKSNFIARFQSNLDNVFNVNPTKGILASYGSKEKTKFSVSFKPKQISVTKTDKLIIETDFFFWQQIITRIFQVRGYLPKYKPPIGQSSIDTKLSLDKSTKFFNPIKKRFIRQNIEKVKKQTKQQSQLR